jgi:neutral trehalase
VLFDWDTYFAALMAAVDDKNIAYANAIAITDEITEKGFIPNVAAIWDKKSNDRSQPPVGSMVCKMIYEKYPEKEFLVSVYDNLLTWNRWWDQNRNHQGYLSWGSNPVQDGLGKQHTKHAGQLESGLDNSPLFDSVDFNEETHMLELGSVGLMGLYIGDCKALADIADELGKNDDARELRKRAKKYSKKLKTMWDEETGIYRDVYLKNGKFSTHLAPTNFYSLISGVPTQKQAERMIEEHYFNEEEFYGEWVMPSISRDNLAFGDNSYWRGRIWAPMNFLVYMGMRNYDLPEARKDLADKSVKLIMKEWTDHNLVFENYNSTTGVGGDVRNSNPYYSWGALLSFIGLWEYGYWDE